MNLSLQIQLNAHHQSRSGQFSLCVRGSLKELSYSNISQPSTITPLHLPRTGIGGNEGKHTSRSSQPLTCRERRKRRLIKVGSHSFSAIVVSGRISCSAGLVEYCAADPKRSEVSLLPSLLWFELLPPHTIRT